MCTMPFGLERTHLGMHWAVVYNLDCLLSNGCPPSARQRLVVLYVNEEL